MKSGVALVGVPDARLVWPGEELYLRTGQGYVGLYHGSKLVFELSARFFAGKPSIWFDHSEKQIAFGLESSRHAGLDLKADQTFEFWQSTFGPRAAIHHHGLGLSFNGYLHDWLGESGLRGHLRSAAALLNDKEGEVIVSPGPVALMSDGALHFGGESLAILRESGIRILSTDTGFRTHVTTGKIATRKTILKLNRDQQPWRLDPPRGPWNYAEQESIFDHALIEANEERDGKRRQRIVFGQGNKESRFRVVPDDPLPENNGHPVHLVMTDARYILELPSGSQTMTAQLAEPLAFSFGSLQLNLSPPQSRPALRASEGSCCILAEGGLVGRIDSAVVMPTEKSKPWNVTVLTDDKEPLYYSDASMQMRKGTPQLSGALQFRVLRPQDALDITFRITNVQLGVWAGQQGRLELAHNASDPSDFSLLIADLSSQTLIMPRIAASSAAESDDCKTNCTAPTDPRSKAAAASRISMRFLRPDDPPVVLSLEALLEWAQYPLNIDPRAFAKPDAAALQIPVSSPISPSATEIVAPAGLSISPDETEAFFASKGVRSDHGVNQIWTARLAKRLPSASGTSAQGARTHFPVTTDRRPVLRPIVARELLGTDYVLKKQDLDIIVGQLRETSASGRHCVLSSRGIWLDFGAIWQPSIASGNTSSFYELIAGMLEQRTVMDLECRLTPTGHRVKLEKSGKLQWCRDMDIDGVPVLVARFIERFKIIYNQPTLLSYDFLRTAADPAIRANVQLPFNSVELIGKETPYLYFPDADSFFTDCEAVMPGDFTYWAWYLPTGSSNPVPYPFPVEFVDRTGTKHRTTMQMLLGCYTQAYTDSYNSSVISHYNSPTVPPHYQSVDTSLHLHGERVAYAKSTKSGNTSYATGKITLTATKVQNLPAAQTAGGIPWYPQMAEAHLILEQVNAFSAPGTPQLGQKFQFATVYKNEPFDDLAGPPTKNRAEVILSIRPDDPNAATPTYTPPPLNFNGSFGGGLAMPSSNVVALGRKAGTVFSGVSRALGTINDVEAKLTAIAQDGMKVSGIFDGLSGVASLLGAVDLSDILDEVADGIAQASKLPLMAVQELQTLEGEIKQLQDLLQPILSFVTLATQFYNLVQGQIQQTETLVRTAIQASASLVRVLATEQRPADVTVLASQTLDATISTLTHGLIPKLSLSAIERIQAAGTPPLQAGVLPTLYQLRDYALNSILEQTAPAAQQLSQALDDALDATQDQLNAALDLASNTAGVAIAQLTGSLIIKFATAGAQLISAISNTQIETAISAIETIADLAAAIPTLDAASAKLKTAITSSITNGVSNSGLSQFQARAALVQTALNTYGAVLPPTVTSTLMAALDPTGAAGSIIDTCTTIFQTATDVINTATQAVQRVLDQEELLRQQFLTQKDSILAKIAQIRQLLSIPKQIQASYDYSTTLHDAGPFRAQFNGNPSTFQLHSSVVVNLDGSPPKFDITAKVLNFSLNLIPSFPFVVIGFDAASFESHDGGAPVVNCPVNAKNVQLVGPLDFIAGLTAALDLPPELIVQLTGLTLIVGYNALLPAIESGALLIVGLSVYTAVKLDFTGQPMRLIFGFATPNQHFIVTYLLLGGGGFVNLEFVPSAGTGGMAVTAALEFGAMAALDFGVASGEVHIFAGIYMSIRPNDLLLSGYYRAGGSLDVLGLITASVEFIMSLNYEDRGGHAWLSGDCELDIDVSVLFFSETVSLHMHHDFSGSSSD